MDNRDAAEQVARHHRDHLGGASERHAGQCRRNLHRNDDLPSDILTLRGLGLRRVETRCSDRGWLFAPVVLPCWSDQTEVSILLSRRLGLIGSLTLLTSPGRADDLLVG